MTLGFIYVPANDSETTVLWTPDVAGFSCGKQKGSRTTVQEAEYHTEQETSEQK
ncbi:unnamed protein product, partial [Musa acuminata subsp. burmannicoides]